MSITVRWLPGIDTNPTGEDGGPHFATFAEAYAAARLLSDAMIFCDPSAGGALVVTRRPAAAWDGELRVGMMRAAATVVTFAAGATFVNALADAPPALLAWNGAAWTGATGATILRVVLPPGDPGVPDDVVVYASAPFGFRILDSWLYVSSLVAASIVTLRNALGGGGAAESDAWSGAGLGVARNMLLTATPLVALGDVLTVRRSDRAVVGEVVILIERT